MHIKYKYIIIVATLALLLYFLGALFKILHWAFPYSEGSFFGGPELIIGSMILWIISGGLLILKAFKAQGNDPLNR